MISSLLSSRRSAPRRAFRFVHPGQQAWLALAILVTTLAFCVLAVGNSYAAYKTLVEVAMSTAPNPLSEDLQAQTERYVRVTSTLAVGYALAVLALSMVFVRRMFGPVVALERHARALKSGDYSSRIQLRSGPSAFAGVASQLNDLATRLDSEAATGASSRRGRPLAI